MRRPALSPRSLILGLGLGACSLVAQGGEPTLDYTVGAQDTLIGLSRQVLVTPDAWPEIARLNALRNPNRLQPGQTLKLPLRLLRSAVLPARLVSAEGEVTVDGRPVRSGDALSTGQALRTGEASSALVELGDGSRLKLTPQTEVSLTEHRRFELRPATSLGTDNGWFASTMRLLRGSLEVLATKVGRAKPLEVTTPTAVIGVRGTEYRVRHRDERSGTEVLEGAVQADAGRAGAQVKAGFGAQLVPDQTLQVVALLPPPDLSQVPQRFERPVVRFQGGSTEAWRVQVATDPAFERLVRDERVPAGAEVRLAGLADGTWQLRARRIDAQGIEGQDATSSFELKARPEPPAPMSPARQAKQTVGMVPFSWAQNTEAARYRLEVAQDAGFTQPLHRADELAGDSVRLPLEQAGTYHWRLASVRANGDRGPWGDPMTLEVRPLPEPPKGGLSADALSLSWSGRPEDRQQVQLARDPGFTQLTHEAELTEARWQLPRPETPGTIYFRYRSVEPDGFVSPWSSTLKIENPRDWRDAPWLLLPLLLAL